MRRGWRAACALVAPLVPLLVVLLVLGVAPATAQKRDKPQSDQPVSFIADELDNDRENDVITATGRVEAWQGERVLVADKVVYDRKKNRIFATGKVAVIEPTGEVIFADYLELSGDMKEGVAREIRMLLADD